MRALPVQADVTRDDAARAMVDRVADELGGLDCLVNNAGWTRRVPHRRLDDLTDEIWERVLATNLRGPFYCARAAVPHMERRGGGAIVNITSVAGATGTGSSMAYAASKGGLDTLTKSLARRARPVAHPGQRGGAGPARHRLRGRAHHGGAPRADRTPHPDRRPVTPEEVADAVVFLLANAALTGYIVTVDGGLTALGAADPRW